MNKADKFHTPRAQCHSLDFGGCERLAPAGSSRRDAMAYFEPAHEVIHLDLPAVLSHLRNRKSHG